MFELDALMYDLLTKAEKYVPYEGLLSTVECKAL